MDHQPQGMQHHWYQHLLKYYRLLVPLLLYQQESIFFHKTLPTDLSQISKWDSRWRFQHVYTHKHAHQSLSGAGANLGNHPNTDHWIGLLTELALYIMLQLNSVFGAILISQEEVYLLTSEAFCILNLPLNLSLIDQTELYRMKRTCMPELYFRNTVIQNMINNNYKHTW